MECTGADSITTSLPWHTQAELSIPAEKRSVHPQIPAQEAVLLCLNN